jgi:N-hydroxyarylamine O-acetyltransferase
MPSDLAHAYLRRLGLPALATDLRAGRPLDLDLLRRLHGAQVERIAYETLDLYRGHPPSLEPRASADRAARGRGGYCFTLGGAFWWLLTDLGYDVRMHPGRVQEDETGRGELPAKPQNQPPQKPPVLNHLALTVHRLDDVPWLVDVGLGDALHQPVPLREGVFWQGPFEYALSRSISGLGPGWWLRHAPGMGFGGVHLADQEVGIEAFTEADHFLGSDRDSVFAGLVTAQRRLADRAETLRGRVLTVTTDAGPLRRTVDSPAEWWGLLTDGFGMVLTDVGEPERARIWDRVSRDHQDWLATQR